MNAARRETSAAGYTVLPRRDPDVIETRSGGGCLSLFGLPFLLAGLFVMQIPFGWIPVENSNAMPWFFFIPFGGIFVLVGGGLVFGRKGLSLDRRKGVMVEWWGPMVPLKRKGQVLDNVKRVSLCKNSGDSDSPATYPVKLEGDAIQDVAIFAPTEYQEARRFAEELSRFLSRPLADFSSGVRIEREPGRLDETFLDRVRKGVEDAGGLPAPPPDMKSRVKETAQGIEIEIPWLPRNPVPRWLQIVLPLVFVGVAAYFFVPFLKLPAPPAVRYFFAGFFLVFFVLGPLVSILRLKNRRKAGGTKVSVTPEQVVVEESRGGKQRTTMIPAEEIEDFDLPTERAVRDSMETPFRHYHLADTGVPRLPDGRPMPRILSALMKLVTSPGISIRSDEAWVQFGSGLAEDELRYLYALIRKVLARGADRTEKLE